MKHLKIILFVFGAMSLTTCTNVNEDSEKIPVEKVERPKVYYTLEEDVLIEVDELTGEANPSEHIILENTNE